MSKRKNCLDDGQLSIFDYDVKIEEYISLKSEILSRPTAPAREPNDWEGDCFAVASSIKKALHESGIARKEMPDLVNKNYGWPTIEEYKKLSSSKKKGLKHLSLEMFNHYLSKPTEYPIPSYYLFAIQSVTKSLEPCRSFAEAVDARVISGDEVRALTLGKLDKTILEMRNLQKELRK